MDTGPPHPQDRRGRRRRAIGAALCAAAGLVLAVLTATGLELGDLSAQHAVAVALPGGLLLIAAGLLVPAGQDPGTWRRLGFKAGLAAGRLASRWRSLFHPPPDGQ
jgi:hypothetical protein